MNTGRMEWIGVGGSKLPGSRWGPEQKLASVNLPVVGGPRNFRTQMSNIKFYVVVYTGLRTTCSLFNC